MSGLSTERSASMRSRRIKPRFPSARSSDPIGAQGHRVKQDLQAEAYPENTQPSGGLRSEKKPSESVGQVRHGSGMRRLRRAKIKIVGKQNTIRLFPAQDGTRPAMVNQPNREQLEYCLPRGGLARQKMPASSPSWSAEGRILFRSSCLAG